MYDASKGVRIKSRIVGGLFMRGSVGRGIVLGLRRSDTVLVWNGCILGINGESEKVVIRRLPEEGRRIPIFKMDGWSIERTAE